MQTAIAVRGVTKSFGKVHALRGIDLDVPKGTVLGLLGPNGAGKSTLVRILATLVSPDAGQATVAGFDVVREPAKLRSVLGLAGQAAAVDEHLTGFENLEFVARFYHLSRKDAKARSRDLLRRVGLESDGNRPVKGYSGGMRRRLDLAMTLVGDPEVIFLDEPTTGLDPPSRSALWAIVEDLRRSGKTILLTTQYLEEADQLADSIAVVDKGTIIARGTAKQLKDQLGAGVVEIVLDNEAHAAQVAVQLKAFHPKLEPGKPRLQVPATKGAKTLAEVVAKLDDKTLLSAEVALRKPTLDDVFLALTGHRADAENSTPPVAATKAAEKAPAAAPAAKPVMTRKSFIPSAKDKPNDARDPSMPPAPRAAKSLKGVRK